MNSKVYGLLGLAAKSGAVVSGSGACERFLRKSTTPLVVVAEDSSVNTREKFQRAAKNREAEIRVFGTCDALGKYIGKESRSILIITDRGFAKSIMDLMDCALRKNGGGEIGENQGL